jgi:CHAT domain-containing protein
MAEPTKAIGYLTQALSILQVTRDETTEAIVLHNLGWYHQLLGEYSTSGNYYRRALRVEDDAFRANTLNNLGRLNASLGDFEAAQEYMQRASSECERHGDGRCKAETLVNLGSLLLQQRQADAARDRFNAAVTTIEGMQNDVWRAKALLGLASVAPNPSAPEVGARIQTAIALVRRLKDRRIEADGLQALGNWYKARNVVSLAKTTYEEALALQQATGEMEGQAQVLLAIAGLLRDSGDLEHALAHVERAIETRESLREQVARPDLRSTYLATTQEYYDLYVDILMALHARTPLAGYDRKALQASERARARGLIEALAERGSDILGRSNPDLVERERALRRKLNARDQRLRTLAGEEGNFERKVKAEQELSATLGDLRELQGEIRSHDPRYAELTHPPELDVKALQQQIDDDSVLLEYWLGTKRSFVWVVTNHSVSSHALPPGEAIESAARRYIATLTARPSNRQPGTATAVAEDEAGRVLGLALLAPLAKELQHRRLIVVRYGALEYIPFAALPLPSAAGTNPTRLIQTHEIVNLPAATVLGSLRKARTRAPQKTIAIFADPVFSRDDPRVRDALQPTADLNRITRDDPTALQRSAAESGLQSLRRLRYSRLEADAIAALVPAGERLEALDFQSNRTTALGNDIAQFRFLHFATHGLLDSVHPELSGLVFSTVDERGRPRDGLVRLHEIFGLSLQADLVVLSACQTALGRDIKGEGLVGLTRGFMYAGAPRVIATLWDVDDRATAELMRRFYQHLLKERPTAAVSLRAAQLSLMQDPQWSSPYYWAGFILLGDWN